MQSWRFWIDRGGTFTDVVALSPGGALQRTKLLSDNPNHYEDAALEAIRRLTGATAGRVPPCQLRIGTTIATNALLERKGARVGLLITRGFGDALRIGTQERPNIFARAIVLPEPIYETVVEVDERIRADGAVEKRLVPAAARQQLEGLREQGIDAVAICLMHGWRHTQHETALAELAREIGFQQVSVSHELAPLIKFVARGDTCVLDAYVSPALKRYVARIERGLGPEGSALFMQSGGGLTDGVRFHGKDAILSGPAGGIVGMAATARQAGFNRVVGFDMGGTSTDVSWFAGRYERDSETRIDGIRIRAPMMRIHTVAAGGGSICRFDGRRFAVGPESAGAQPGPACYRSDGPLSVTDCNLALGRIQSAHFPAVFGPAGDQPPDVEVVSRRLEAVVKQVRDHVGRDLTPEEVAQGFLDIAVGNMAQAIKAVSIRRGHDLNGAVLAAFGGAAGQLACRVAEALDLRAVQCHPLASVLSAYGMGLADRRAIREATVSLPLIPGNRAAVDARISEIDSEARAELVAQGIAEDSIETELVLGLRPEGSENTVEIPVIDGLDLEDAFTQAWIARFGFAADGAVIVEGARLEAISRSREDAQRFIALPETSGGPVETVQVYFAEGWKRVPVLSRSDLAAGFERPGPVLIVDDVSTIVIDPGWAMRVDPHGNVIASRTETGERQNVRSGERDPVRLEIMAALFMGIAEEMGASLQFSASSVNIRERLDFSCALFDRSGNLVANAPHMPVHLGSMGESVRAILRKRGGGADGRGIQSGDAYALNAPYEGGTHLPDITVVMPVFADTGDAEPAWYVAARGHHADIGGITPGSMPPDSKTIDEEGVLLDNVLLVDRGRLCETELRSLLASGRWPARNPDRNIADLKAQLAACAKGSAELRRLATQQGRNVVDAYMEHVQSYSEEAVRAMLSGLDDGHFRYVMDDGSAVEVAVWIDREKGSAVFDFTGSSAQLPGNFNAPLPIVRATVLYAVRTLIAGDVPMNEGCLRPIEIVVPDSCMLNPRPGAAVVAGNVETSQAVTDAIFGALGALAASQGTMNNFTFGNNEHQYYETIAGGSGAGPGFHGASAVQTHMTNSRLTDPEVLESSFPVVLEEFAIRRSSGGSGRWRGGDGVVRRLRFTEAMEAAILSNRRIVPPFGMAGGEPGHCGRNTVRRADGKVECLSSCASTHVNPGDSVEIATPGGGGFGARDDTFT